MFSSWGNKHADVLLPTRVQTVGQMRDPQSRVAALCLKCPVMQKVDLEAIGQLRGRSHSLIDKRSPGQVLAADRKAILMSSSGDNTPWRSLSTDRGEMAWMFTQGVYRSKQKPGGDDDPEPPKPPAPPVPMGVDPHARAVAADASASA